MQGDAKDAEDANLDAYNLYAEAEEMLSPCQTPANQLSSTGTDTNPADRGKERTSDKKQKSDKKNKGEDPNGDPSGDPNEDPNKGDDPSNNEDPESTPSPSPTSTPTPTEDPFAGENGDQKQRREDLIHQNDEHNRDQREQDDKGRSGNPNGAW